MTGELINTDALAGALVTLANMLGMTIQQMYVIYVSAQQIIGIVQIVLTVVWAIGIIAILMYLYRYYKANKQPDSYSDMTGVICLVAAILACIIFTLVLWNMYDAIIAVLCPQYAALQAMMRDIGKLLT
jgi:uncharacterized membrane protein YidH (DUF202 family)